MKKIFALILVFILVFTLAACGGKKSEPTTVGQKLYAEFQELAKENSDSSLTLAEQLAASEVLPFDAGVMGVEPGFLTGFDTEISGFQEGAFFAPFIGTIPFVGYVFILEDGADVEAFEETLKTTSNPRWNICTEAEETVVGSEGNVVFFVMCPSAFEE